MDGKGDGEEITYPHVCFSVDNFDEAFEDVVVRDGESVGIELTATAPKAAINTVLFTACVPYETVRRVHDARASQTVRKRLSQASLFSLFSGKSAGPRVEYVRLLGGTDVNGHAELAVAKTSVGCETPCSEPGTDMLDLWGDSDDEYADPIRGLAQSPYNQPPRSLSRNHQQPPPPQQQAEESNIVGTKRGHHRRLSDPSSTIHDFMRMGILDQSSNSKQHQLQQPQPLLGSRFFGSESDGLDSFGEAHCEIYAGDLLDEFEEAKYNPLWTMRGYTQIFHSWRESKRCQSVPLSSACTYVMLPWWSIIKSVLDEQQQPLLTF
jgi:hypothetical protein